MPIARRPDGSYDYAKSGKTQEPTARPERTAAQERVQRLIDSMDDEELADTVAAAERALGRRQTGQPRPRFENGRRAE